MTTYENHLEQVEGLLDAIVKSSTRQCNKAMAIDALAHVIRAKKILSQYKEGLITKEIYCTCGKSKLCDVKCSACGKIAFTD